MMLRADSRSVQEAEHHQDSRNKDRKAREKRHSYRCSAGLLQTGAGAHVDPTPKRENQE